MFLSLLACDPLPLDDCHGMRGHECFGVENSYRNAILAA
jgi:hypothetical protein